MNDDARDAARYRAIAAQYVSADFEHEVEYIDGSKAIEPVVQCRIPAGVRITASLDDYADALLAMTTLSPRDRADRGNGE